MTPEELLRFLQQTVDEGFVSQLYKAASVREAEVLEALRGADIDVYSLQEIQRIPTDLLDGVANTHLRQARRMGALAGVSYGAFGILTAVPELMHLMIAVVRTAQRLSLTYGQEYESFRGSLQLWEAIAQAFGVDPSSFEGAEPELFRNMPVPMWTSNQVRWNPIILGVARQVLITLAFIFLKKRWARAVPLVGVGLSGIGNYTLLRRVGLSLKGEFRQRHQLMSLAGDVSSVSVEFRVD